MIKVGRAGLLKIFGHDHLIEVRRYSGEVHWKPDAKESSSLRLDIESASLTVVDEKVSEDDKAKIQAEMESNVLEVGVYPSIRFESSEIRFRGGNGGEYRATLVGELTLHGVARTIEIPLRFTVNDGLFRARAEFKLKGSWFGIEPVSVAGGAMKTKDELEFTFDLVFQQKSE
jgi:polyisoprenoid-binding protein YceI